MKIIKLFKRLVLSITLIVVCGNVQAQGTVVFSTTNLANGVIEQGAGSMNSCWILDSDIERPRNTSNEARWDEMDLGSVRYPYGHLAENYLWDTPPYGGTLVDKVCSMKKAPGTFSWAVNPNRTMKKTMDFDEFMAICQRKNIKPLIVINTQGHKFTDSQVTYQELKTTAVEWVKYAKAKGYQVAYWQLGNEIDHGSSLLTTTEYINLYKDFVTAMKAADPSILCGPGLHSTSSFFNNLMVSNSNLIDFTSVHQYLFDHPIKNYSTWLNHNGNDLNANVKKIQNAVNNSSKPSLPILVTEMNAFGNWKNADDSNNKWPAMYKGLSVFDMLFTQQAFEDVQYSYIWNSHSPWGGSENVDEGVANALFNDQNNRITPMGMPIKILNTTAESRVMRPNNKVQGVTYSYGTYTPATGKSTIYLLNKSTSAVTMNVTINNYDMSNTYERWVWAPSVNQYSADYTFARTGNITQTNSGFRTTVPASSLVVVKLNATSAIKFVDNVGANLRMRSNSENTDVTSSATTNTGWLGKWNIIDAGNGYVFIQNQANGLRLQGTSSATGVQSSVKLVSGTSNGSWVQWKLIPVGSNYYIDNRAHNTRLSVNGEGEIIVGSTSWGGNWVQWRLTDGVFAKESNNKSSTIPETNVDSHEILIYPNILKAGDNFNLHYTSQEEDDILKIRIIDVSGKVMLNKEENLRSGLNKLNVQPNRLSQGIYFIELSLKETKSTKKIIIN